MAEQDKADGAEDQGKSKKKTVLIIVVAVVLALLLGGGGVAAYFVLSDDPAAEESGQAQSKPRQEAIYTKVRTLEGKPMFVVSLESADDKQHYMQLYVEAKSREPDVDEALQLHMPLIVARLNTLFSSHSYEELQSVEGKRLMQADALQTVQQILQEKIGKPGVERILFTNMVMQ